jgi:hypothetical protein
VGEIMTEFTKPELGNPKGVEAEGTNASWKNRTRRTQQLSLCHSVQ